MYRANRQVFSDFWQTCHKLTDRTTWVDLFENNNNNNHIMEKVFDRRLKIATNGCFNAGSPNSPKADLRKRRSESIACRPTDDEYKCKYKTGSNLSFAEDNQNESIQKTLSELDIYRHFATFHDNSDNFEASFQHLVCFSSHFRPLSP